MAVLAVPISEEASFFHLCLVFCCKKCNYRCLDTNAGVLELEGAQFLESSGSASLAACGCLLMQGCCCWDFIRQG